ncbi:MAG: hypothetical protein KIS96_10265 [Bauldia sp.]|nr:hypothetical protein [Bauldia sp.]
MTTRSPALRRYRFEGHAIVSADDRIADSGGGKPDRLNNPADWARFQAALAEAALILIGRKSHEADPPTTRQRNRLIVSSSAAGGLEQRADGWWWNPGAASLEDALAAAAPAGGLVAIPGGQRVFDDFLGVGYDAFHLARNPNVTLPGGVGVFSACERGVSAEDVLSGAGLLPAEYEVLDPAANVTVTVWRPAL